MATRTATHTVEGAARHTTAMCGVRLVDCQQAARYHRGVLVDWPHLCPAKTVAMAPAPGSHSRTSVSWQPAATRQCAAATGDMATELTLLGSWKELTTSTLKGRPGGVRESVEWKLGNGESG